MESEAMDVAGIIISPSTHQKIKARNAAMRLKHGAPQFKDVLRKRFRNRIKENRGRLFDRLRCVSESQTGSISKLIQEELLYILSSEDLNELDDEEENRIREEIESDTLLDEEQWLLQQYDLIMADDNTLQELWEETELVVCPVCRKGNLLCDAISQMIRCEHCVMTMPARASLGEIQERIYKTVNRHGETECQEDTQFFVFPDDSSLYAHCNACKFFDLTV